MVLATKLIVTFIISVLTIAPLRGSPKRNVLVDLNRFDLT